MNLHCVCRALPYLKGRDQPVSRMSGGADRLGSPKGSNLME